MLKLTSHLWKHLPESFDEDLISPPAPKAAITFSEPIKKVAFLTHLINTDNLKTVDPLFKNLPFSERLRFHRKFGPFDTGYKYHEQIIRGHGGRQIQLHLYGLLAGSDFFASSLENRTSAGFLKIQSLANKAVADGMHFIGLGQYTSIVTDNATLLRRQPAFLTTGNSLTAGLSYAGLLKLCHDRHLDLKTLRVGVLGATGNICNSLTQILADDVGALTLFSRESFNQSEKLQRAVAMIVENSKMPRERIKTSTHLSDLLECDIVMSGTSSAEALIFPEHLKTKALVLDISVPSNIDPSVRKKRLDVEAFQGGFAKLPYGQNLETGIVPCPKGEVFACLAETICMGLHDHQGHLSYGSVTKDGIKLALRLAEEAGFSLGSLKREALF